MKLSPEYYKKRYQIMKRRRETTFDILLNDDFREEWFIQRPSIHQWSIDEILRHMIGNEIRYLQQPLDNSIQQHEFAVRAQWVGNIFFRLEEGTHISRERLISEFKEIQNHSILLLDTLTDAILDNFQKAPWGEILMIRDLITDLFDHDQFHRGQVHYLITYYRGLPQFIDPPDDIKFG